MKRNLAKMTVDSKETTKKDVHPFFAKRPKTEKQPSIEWKEHGTLIVGKYMEPKASKMIAAFDLASIRQNLHILDKSASNKL